MIARSFFLLITVVEIMCCAQQQKGQPDGPRPGWLSIFPAGQRIFSIQADLRNPTTLYACTHRGLFKTLDAGMVWASVFSIDASYLTFAQSKTSPNVMYLGVANDTKGQVLTSTDGGNVWGRIGAEDIQSAIRSVQVDPKDSGTVYVVSNSSVYKTLNGGRTWADVAPHVRSPQAPTSMQVNLLALDPQRSGHLLANYDKRNPATKNDSGRDVSNLWESNDGGLSWQHKTGTIVIAPNKAIASNWEAVSFHPNDSNQLAGTAGGDTWGGSNPPILAVSRDGGATWRDVRIVEKAGYRSTADMRSFAWSLKEPSTFYAGTSESLYTSSDSGLNWRRILPLQTTSLLTLDTGDLYAATVAGVLKSKTGGRTWHLAGLGLPTEVRDVAVSMNSIDAFNAYQQGYGTNLFVLQAVEGQTIYVSGRGGFWDSPDGGISWSWHSIPSDLSAGISGDIIPQYRGPNVRQLLVAKDKTLFLNLVTQGALGGGESQLLKIQPDGKVVKVDTRRAPNMIGISPNEPTVVYMTASEGQGSWIFPSAGSFLMKSDDSGFSWQTSDLRRGLGAKVSGWGITGIPSFAVSPSSSKVVYVLASLRNPNTREAGIAIELTSDGGATWRDVFDVGGNVSVTNSAIAIDPKDDKTAYVAINQRLFRTGDGGAKWTTLPLNGEVINGLAISSQPSQLLYAATSTGAWMSTNAGAAWLPLNTGGLIRENLKSVFSLGQLTLAQGYNGIYRLTDGDVAWLKSKWQQYEDQPESNPIHFQVTNLPEAQKSADSKPDIPQAGGKTTPPVVISKVEAKSTDEARRKRFTGTVSVSLVVGEDGVPRDIHINNSPGMGLDENVIAALKQWRFKPATKDGIPVPVRATIEVTFARF